MLVVDYTVLQAPADSESVVDGLGTLAPGWSDRDAVGHAQGWTSVRLGRSAAGRFAPLLVKLLRRDVLVWTVDAEHCQVSWYQDNGDVLEAVDRLDQVEELANAFSANHVLTSDKSASGTDKAVLPTAAIDSARSPADRHKGFAELLGVPYLVPDAPPRPIAATPALTMAGPSVAEARFRRQQRVRNARSWLHLASGLCMVAAVPLVIRGALVEVGIALVASGLLQVVRYLLGRSLPHASRPRLRATRERGRTRGQ